MTNCDWTKNFESVNAFKTKVNVSIYHFKQKHFYLFVSKNIKMFWEINFKLLMVYWKLNTVLYGKMYSPLTNIKVNNM